METDKAYPPIAKLIYGNLPRLDLLGLGQSQSKNSLLHFCGDFSSVHGRIELEDAAKNIIMRLAEECFASGCLVTAMTRDGEFIIFERDFESLFAHARHFSFQHISFLRLVNVHAG